MPNNGFELLNFVTGKLWHNQRRMLAPAFHFGIFNELADLMWQKAEVMNDCIANSFKNNPDRPINIFDFVLRCTLESLCQTAMGIDEDMQHKTNNAYVEAVQKLVEFSQN